MLIILLYIYGSLPSFSQFTLIETPDSPPPPFDYFYFSDRLIDFGDMQTGYYSAYIDISPSGGGEYYLDQTIDGGVTWFEANTFRAGTSFQNYLLLAVNKEICFSAFNADGFDRVCRVSDNGETMQAIISAPYLTPLSMTELNDSMFYLTAGKYYFQDGKYSYLYRIEGDNSFEVYSKKEDSLLMLKPLFINPDTGFIISEYPFDSSYSILRTIDAGLSWQECFLNDSLKITDIDFFSQTAGIISCTEGQLFRTIDAGTNWEPIYLGDMKKINCLGCIDENTGYCGTDSGGFYKT